MKTVVLTKSKGWKTHSKANGDSLPIYDAPKTQRKRKLKHFYTNRNFSSCQTLISKEKSKKISKEVHTFRMSRPNLKEELANLVQVRT